MKPGKLFIFLLLIQLFFSCLAKSGFTEDSNVSRATLAGIQGVQVIVEGMQQNLQKYAAKLGSNAEQIKREVETRLHNQGIRVVYGSDWLKVPGRPVLYINVNTHETEKYWYAYDVKLELRQIVYLETNLKTRTLADTWSINMTGMVNIGNLDIIKSDTMFLLERFVNAYKSANTGN